MQPEKRPETVGPGLGPFETALVDIVREADPAGLVAALPALFAAHGLGAAAGRLRADPRAARRILAYRSLVHARFRGVVEVTMPRVAATLGEARLAAEVARFVEARASRSPYVRDVASELLAWWADRWPGDATVPGHLLDHARHELLAVDVAAAEDDEPLAGEGEAPVAATSVLRFQRGARLVRYAWAVHHLHDDDVDTLPARADTALLAYRDDRHLVRYLELSPLAAVLVERLMGGAALELAVREACASTDRPLDDATLAELAALLDDLEARGIVLGAQAGV